MLQLADLRLGSVGGAQPCVLTWTGVCSVAEQRQVLLLPLFSRDGGILCALPADLRAEVLAGAEAPLPSKVLGPAHIATLPAIEEDDAGVGDPCCWPGHTWLS